MKTVTASFALQVCVFFALWVVSSGRTGPRDLIVGFAASLLVAILNRPLQWRLAQPRLAILPFLFRYLPWLIWQIILANLQVAYLVLHPKLKAQPVWVEMPTRLQLTTSQTLLASSITLTPGTLTVDIQKGTFLVHALTPQSAELLENGELPNRVARLFGEPPVAEGIRTWRADDAGEGHQEA